MKYLLIIIAVTLLQGCDYISHEVYEIVTKDGKILKLSCPTIDRTRSNLTFIYDGDCVLVR